MQTFFRILECTVMTWSSIVALRETAVCVPFGFLVILEVLSHPEFETSSSQLASSSLELAVYSYHFRFLARIHHEPEVE